MQDTITAGSNPESTNRSLAEWTTPGDIEAAYSVVLAKLKATVDKAAEFVEACDYAGKLLTRKREEIGHGQWLPWLSENCPEISPRTAQRLIKIHTLRANASRRAYLNGPVSSVRMLCDMLEQDARESALSDHRSPKAATPARSPVIAAIARFWGSITKRPPEKWVAEERGEFLRDLAERERIRRAQGWELPAIDIEAEEIGA